MLFNKSKNIYELEITNFRNKNNKIKVIHPKLKEKTPGIILFYHSWCPYCKMLVPIWRKLAKELSKKNIFVGVIDGSSSEFNATVFDQVNVKAVPDIRYITSEHTIGRKFKKERNIENLIKFIGK